MAFERKKGKKDDDIIKMKYINALRTTKQTNAPEFFNASTLNKKSNKHGHRES